LEKFQMKKTLIALAAVAVSSAAMAQATIGGTFNVDMQNKISNADNTIGMGDAIVSVSVSEDLGGGMTASAGTTFQTKAGRAGTVSNNGYSFALKGGFGALSLVNGLVGHNEVSAGVSAEDDMSDSLGAYFLRTRLQYALPQIVPGLGIQLRFDQDGAADTGGIAAVAKVTPSSSNAKFNLDYTIGAGYISYGDNLNDASGGTVYTGYDFGVAKVDLALTTYDHTEIAITAPLGANLSAGLHIQTGNYADAIGARVTYALSKRTALSFNYVDVTNASENSTTGAGSNYRVRLSHNF
jgi:hypothetical protein